MGYNPWDHKESDTTERLTSHFIFISHLEDIENKSDAYI